MRNSVVKNIVWSVVERLSSQIVFFAVSILIARIIDPTEYGVVATITVIVNIFGGAIQSGFSSALIYKKEATKEDYSIAFWCTLVMCLVFYIVLFLVAPLVAIFYQNGKIILLMRVQSIQIILQGIHSIPFAYVSKKMEFKKNYVATIMGVLVSSGFSLLLAFTGFGVWALVFTTSIEVLISATVLWVFTRLRIQLVFRMDIAKEMFSYCWKLMGVDMLNSAYSNINSMIIGKKYNTAEVAYYNRAYSLPQTLLGSANTAVSKVLFPAFAENSDSNAILHNLRRSIKTINYVTFPMLTGLLAISEELILVLYTKKWAATIPYLNVMCFIWMFQPVQTCVIQAFKAIGKSDEYFKLEIIKKIFSIALLVVSVLAFNTPLALAYALGAGQIFSTLMNSSSLKKHLRYSYKQQIVDMSASMGLCAIMFLLTYGVGLFFSGMKVRLVVRVFVGVMSYLILSVVTKNEQFKFFEDTFLGRKVKNSEYKAED